MALNIYTLFDVPDLSHEAGLAGAPGCIDPALGRLWLSGVTEVIPNIEYRVKMKVPYAAWSDDGYIYRNINASLRQSDTPEGLDPPWGSNWTQIWYRSPSMHKCPLEYEDLVVVTKPFLAVCFYIVADGCHWGNVSLAAELETMDAAIYNRLMRAKRVTLKQVEACGEQADEHAAAATVASEKGAELELEMALFNQFLSEEIALYEQIQGGG